MYCTAICPYCIRAEHLLRAKGLEIDKIRIDLEPDRYSEMVQVSGGRTTVPQIFIGETHVGGCDELHALEREGRLDPLLEAELGWTAPGEA
ncbi:MAG TPA: glutaredoxin 3 [Thiotrichales bacterium]|nr:glutaredoxin 3 [Thiotrichales bacterium]